MSENDNGKRERESEELEDEERPVKRSVSSVSGSDEADSKMNQGEDEEKKLEDLEGGGGGDNRVNDKEIKNEITDTETGVDTPTEGQSHAIEAGAENNNLGSGSGNTDENQSNQIDIISQKEENEPREINQEDPEETPAAIVIDRTGTEAAATDGPETRSGEADPPIQASSESEDKQVPNTEKHEPSGLPPGVYGQSIAHNEIAGGPPTYGTPPSTEPARQYSTTNPDQMVEEKGEIPALHVGRVIGRGGEMIRDLQARSGARLDVDQNVPPGQPRIITYRGTRRTVDFAKRLVYMLAFEGVDEANLPLGDARREVLVIPSQSVGKIIGRGGEMIRELQSRSQAKIQIDHSGTSGLPPEQKQVTITGSDQSVSKAKEMVMFLVANPIMDAMQSLNLLTEEKLRSGMTWGSGPPYSGLPNGGQNMQPHSVPGYGSGGFPVTFDQSYPQQMGYAPNVHSSYVSPPQQYQQPSYESYAPQPSGGIEIDTIFAQKQFMGRIIGQKGATINDLQRRSGTDIQINQDVPPGHDCQITVKGTRQGIEAVKQMVREIIEIGPQHPYAGGAENYQARNSTYGEGYQQQTYGTYTDNFGQYSQSTYAGGPVGYVTSPAPQPYSAYGQMYGAQGYPPYQQPAPAPGPTHPMPAVTGWKSALSPDGKTYYYNELTGATQWEKPAGMM